MALRKNKHSMGAGFYLRLMEKIEEIKTIKDAKDPNTL
jgi:hypothetical protein